jgi:hypothetical protein
LADSAAGLQLMRFSIDRDGVDVTLEASFAMAGLGMDPVRLEHDIGACAWEGTGKGVSPRRWMIRSRRSVRSRCDGLGAGARWVPAVRRIAASSATTDVNMIGGLGIRSTKDGHV